MSLVYMPPPRGNANRQVKRLILVNLFISVSDSQSLCGFTEKSIIWMCCAIRSYLANPSRPGRSIQALNEALAQTASYGWGFQGRAVTDNSYI